MPSVEVHIPPPTGWAGPSPGSIAATCRRSSMTVSTPKRLAASAHRSCDARLPMSCSSCRARLPPCCQPTLWPSSSSSSVQRLQTHQHRQTACWPTQPLPGGAPLKIAGQIVCWAAWWCTVARAPDGLHHQRQLSQVSALLPAEAPGLGGLLGSDTPALDHQHGRAGLGHVVRCRAANHPTTNHHHVVRHASSIASGQGAQGTAGAGESGEPGDGSGWVAG